MLRRTSILLITFAVVALTAQGALANTAVRPKPSAAKPKPVVVKPKPVVVKPKPTAPAAKPPAVQPATPAPTAPTAPAVPAVPVPAVPAPAPAAPTPAPAPAPAQPTVGLTVTTSAGRCVVNLSVAGLTPRYGYTITYSTSAGTSSNVLVWGTADAGGRLSDSRIVGSKSLWGRGRTVSVTVVGVTSPIAASANSC